MARWLILDTTAGQVLHILVDHIAMVSEFYVEKTVRGADGKNHLEAEVILDKCNILVQGQYISVKGSVILIKTLITKALADEKATGSPILLQPNKES